MYDELSARRTSTERDDRDTGPIARATMVILTVIVATALVLSTLAFCGIVVLLLWKALVAIAQSV